MTVTVMATFDYAANNPDELSFCKHAIITNVVKNTGSPGWWKGDYGGAKQLYFPQNFVKEIETGEGSDSDELVSTNLVNLRSNFNISLFFQISLCYFERFSIYFFIPPWILISW